MNRDATFRGAALLFAALAVLLCATFVWLGASPEVIGLPYGGGVSAVLALLFGRAAREARAQQRSLIEVPPPP